jgi:hypothetical protein
MGTITFSRTMQWPPTFWTNSGSAAPLCEVIGTSRSGGIGSVPPSIVATVMQRN